MSIIGIDLGTTNSCVAVFNHDHVEVLSNPEGGHTTPSCVAFTDDGIIIGALALKQLGHNPKNTLYAVKRLIGRRFTDKSVESDRKYWSFDVIQENDMPMMKVEINGKPETYSAEYISSLILCGMKEIAMTRLEDKTLKDAVITVPASFNSNQRQATKDAARAAGLNVRRMINEPTAAALAYGYNNNKIVKGKTVLVYDIGGGTFDVSILKMKDSLLEVISTQGDSYLGGIDFDNAMFDHFIAEIKRRHGKDISENSKAVMRLRKKCENAKKELSFKEEVDVDIDHLFDATGFKTKITRARFENLTEKLMQSTVTLVETALETIGMHRSEIDSIILVGGSSRIPKIHALLKEYFHGKELNISLDPDEAIAYGAAVQGAILSGAIRDFMMKDVTPLSLGVDVIGDRMSVIIKRNTPIPVKQTETYHTTQDNQTKINFKVHEGENAKASVNVSLDEFSVSGFPPAPAGMMKCDVTFEIDADGILNVSAVNKATGESQKITVSNYKGKISQEDNNRMTKDTEEFRAVSRKKQERVAAKNKLESYARQMKSEVQNPGVISLAERDEIIEKCNKVIDWLAENEDAQKKEYEDRYGRLKLCIKAIIG